MKDFKILTRDIIPCWYELSFREKKPAIILKAHKDFIKVNWDENHIIKHFKEEFGFKKFVGDFYKRFGFDNGAFMFSRETGDFVELLMKIPKIKREKGSCLYCKGSGQGDFLDGKCLNCNGSGKDWEYDWPRAYAISASFNVFFQLAGLPDKDTSSSLYQLLTVHTHTSKGMHGGSLWGEYSIPLVRWLASFEQRTTIPQMVQAMKMTYRMIHDELIEFDEYYFKASVDYENGWLNISCPGDACGLYPGRNAGYGIQRGFGYEFSCHNVDSPMQQLVLLAGLAALHDRAREEIK